MLYCELHLCTVACIIIRTVIAVSELGSFAVDFDLDSDFCVFVHVFVNCGQVDCLVVNFLSVSYCDFISLAAPV